MDLDRTDFLILKQIYDADQPPWKNRIHEQQSGLFTEPVSVQTVGRRVDALQEDDYLESCITSPDEIKRDLIIAFKLTDKGEDALIKKRRELLLKEVRTEIFQHETVEDRMNREATVELACSEFGLDEASHPFDQCSQEELLTVLLLYFVQNDVFDLFSDKLLETAEELAGTCPKLAPVVDEQVQDLISH